MLATYQMQTNMASSRHHAERMPFAMPAMGMCMSAAAASAIIMKTGVLAPVSLFVVVLLVVSLLLSGLVLIISLLLTGLTGLVGLESLVRLIAKPAMRNARGD